MITHKTAFGRVFFPVFWKMGKTKPVHTGGERRRFQPLALSFFYSTRIAIALLSQSFCNEMFTFSRPDFFLWIRLRFFPGAFPKIINENPA